MGDMWIGEITAHDVTGTVGLGYLNIYGAHTVSKENVGNGSIIGEHGHLPTFMALVFDPDFWDCLYMTGQPGTGG